MFVLKFEVLLAPLCVWTSWNTPSCMEYPFLQFCSCSRFLKKFQKLEGNEDDFRQFQHLQRKFALTSPFPLFDLLSLVAAVAPFEASHVLGVQFNEALSQFNLRRDDLHTIFSSKLHFLMFFRLLFRCVNVFTFARPVQRREF